MREQRVVLGNVTKSSVFDRDLDATGRVEQRGSSDHDAPGAGPPHAEDHEQQCGFARTVRPYDDERAAPRIESSLDLSRADTTTYDCLQHEIAFQYSGGVSTAERASTARTKSNTTKATMTSTSDRACAARKSDSNAV